MNLPPTYLNNPLTVVLYAAIILVVVYAGLWLRNEVQHRQAMRHWRETMELKVWEQEQGLDSEVMREFARCREAGGCQGRE